MHMTAAEIHGERIYNHLLRHGATTKSDLAHTLGITSRQVEAGLRNIREVVANRESEPLVMDPHGWTYDLAADERQAVRYLRYRLSIIRRYLLNLNTSTMMPAAEKFASPSLSLLQHQMEQVSNSIEFAEAMLS